MSAAADLSVSTLLTAQNSSKSLEIKVLRDERTDNSSDTVRATAFLDLDGDKKPERPMTAMEKPRFGGVS